MSRHLDLDWTWSFRLAELPGGSTRLQLRVRGRMAPWWLIATYLAAIVPADYVMAGGMLRGVKQRAESGAPPKLSGRSPLAASVSTWSSTEGEVCEWPDRLDEAAKQPELLGSAHAVGRPPGQVDERSRGESHLHNGQGDDQPLLGAGEVTPPLHRCHDPH